jgi:hypothetical protein
MNLRVPDRISMVVTSKTSVSSSSGSPSSSVLRSDCISPATWWLEVISSGGLSFCACIRQTDVCVGTHRCNAHMVVRLVIETGLLKALENSVYDVCINRMYIKWTHKFSCSALRMLGC